MRFKHRVTEKHAKKKIVGIDAAFLEHRNIDFTAKKQRKCLDESLIHVVSRSRRWMAASKLCFTAHMEIITDNHGTRITMGPSK